MNTFTRDLSKRKNVYIEDLEFTGETNPDYSRIEFTLNGEVKAEICIRCWLAEQESEEGDRYSIYNYVIANKEIEGRISSRASDTTLEAMNIRLRDLQYFMKKAWISRGDKVIENPAITPELSPEPVVELDEIDIPEPKEVEQMIERNGEIDEEELRLKLKAELRAEMKAEALKKEQRKPMGLEAQIIDLVEEKLESASSQDLIIGTISTKLEEWGIQKNVVEHIVKRSEEDEGIKVGVQHKLFPKILQTLSAGVNIALVGPAGSGKTTCVSKASKSLGLPFYSQSVSAQTASFDFFGYSDANGNYVRTIFREAYENGGVFLLDEFDNGNPNVLAALNQATENEQCSFPDGMIQRHKDFIVVMAGNTFGHGATTEYVGRNQIDGATLDRFVFIHFPYDENFEYLLAGDKAWCLKVQKIREQVKVKKIKAIVSPRATINGSKLLKAGMSEKDVIEFTILKGLSQNERNLLEI